MEIDLLNFSQFIVLNLVFTRPTVGIVYRFSPIVIVVFLQFYILIRAIA
jgi:hypothetical protein